ncbi:MAG: hypothetical protein V1840_01630 [Candidatus Omnitrophota bacterium]
MFKQSHLYGVIGLAALFLFTMQPALQPVFAQPAKQGMPGMQEHKKMTPEEMAKKDEERINARVQEMTKNLGLTPEQQAQVRDILTKTASEARKIMQETRVKIVGLMEKDRDAIKALLTEEQKKMFEAMRPKPGQGQVPPLPQTPAEGK